jgi:hypothetical protein
MRRLILPTLALSMLVGLGGCHEGVHSSHGHSHHGHDGDYTLSLNQGQKWETDEALRHAMHGIRELVESAGSAPLDAAGLSSGVEANIEYMVKHCKLDPEADNVLHVIIGEMVESIALLSGGENKADPNQALEQLDKALQTYGHYFDHPGWEDAHASH